MPRKKELTEREKESQRFQAYFENFLKEIGLGPIFFDDEPPVQNQTEPKPNRTKTKQNQNQTEPKPNRTKTNQNQTEPKTPN